MALDGKKQWDFIREIKGSGYGQAGENPLNIFEVPACKRRNHAGII
jgi:hypothetical protein